MSFCDDRHRTRFSWHDALLNRTTTCPRHLMVGAPKRQRVDYVHGRAVIVRFKSSEIAFIITLPRGKDALFVVRGNVLGISGG